MTKGHILLIEDHEDTREILAFVLSRAGFAVTGVATLEEARHEIHAEHYDLYVVDCVFPTESGADFCREIRRTDAATPIVIHSALARSEDVAAGLSAGANVYLAKPVEMSVLLEAVQSLVPPSEDHPGLML